jgi:hypothetical protein
MEKSVEIKNLAIALCKFQSEVEKIKKEEMNPFFKKPYASLSNILDVIRQPLADNGLSFVQFPSGEYGLETMLMHVSGEWLSEGYKMTPTKNDPQGAGSVITYQRRYALGAILGLNIDSDDDGNAGSEPVKPKKKELLTSVHPKWNDAIKYLKGEGTMTKILETYEVSKEFQEKLINATLE